MSIGKKYGAWAILDKPFDCRRLVDIVVEASSAQQGDESAPAA